MLFVLAVIWWRTRSATWSEELLMSWRSWRDCERTHTHVNVHVRHMSAEQTLTCRLYICFVPPVASIRTVSANFQSCCSRRTNCSLDCKCPTSLLNSQPVKVVQWWRISAHRPEASIKMASSFPGLGLTPNIYRTSIWPVFVDSWNNNYFCACTYFVYIWFLQFEQNT